MKRFAVVALVIVLALALAPIVCTRKTGNGRNVIILMVDTLRADHLGYHGYGRPTTPGLDRFAEKSSAFMSHFSHASRTGPSVASLFTSLHVRSHGVVNPIGQWDGKGVLEESRTTLAEILSAAGYSCRAVVSNPNVYHMYGFAQGFEAYHPVPLHSDAGRINAMAIQQLAGMKEKPFFLYLHYMDPHSPYSAPPAFGRAFSDDKYAGFLTGEHSQIDRILRGEIRTTRADEKHLVDLYDQEVRYWDWEFGRLTGFLEESGLLENTVVVVVSDHGEEFFEHGGVLHGYTLYGEQLRVPLVVWAPGFLPRKVGGVTRNIDVLPTILDLLDLPVPREIQGESLVPFMKGGERKDPPVFSEAGIRAVKTVKARSFRANGWKYIETTFPDKVPPELYDLSADPGEKENVYTSRPDMAEKMRKMMDEFLEGVPEGTSRSVTLDKEAIEQLKALGYVGGDDGK